LTDGSLQQTRVGFPDPVIRLLLSNAFWTSGRRRGNDRIWSTVGSPRDHLPPPAVHSREAAWCVNHYTDVGFRSRQYV